MDVTINYVHMKKIDTTETHAITHQAALCEVITQQLPVFVLTNFREKERCGSETRHALGNVPPHPSKRCPQQARIGTLLLQKAEEG